MEALSNPAVVLTVHNAMKQQSGSLPTPVESAISIYDIRSKRQRLCVLVIVSLCALILPFSDSVYLPALAQIEHDLHASTVLVDYTVSAYLIAAGMAGLIWGPLSDRFGRKIILVTALGFFLAFTIVCIFVRTIAVLLIFRSLQGSTIVASFVVGQSAIVDMYPPEGLGFAMGLFLVPLLVGPILGPFIGGILTNWFGWRSTFVALAVMAVISAALILLFVPETHHYLTLQRLTSSKKKNSGEPSEKSAIRIREAETILKPRFLAPWRPLIFLGDMTIIPHTFLCNFNFASLFVLFTLMANREAEKPYSLSPLFIGMSYIPTGASSLTGSILGGWISDWSAKRFPRAIESRLLFNLIGCLSCPVGLLLSGWSFHFGVHLAAPILGATLFCFGEAFMYTGTCAFVTVKKPNDTGAVLSLVNSFGFLAAGIGIIVVAPLLAVMQFGPLSSVLAGINLSLIGISMAITVHHLRKLDSVAVSFDACKANSSPQPFVEKPKDITPIQWF